MEIINFARELSTRFLGVYLLDKEEKPKAEEEIMRRANEIKILDAGERKLKAKSFLLGSLVQFKSVKQSLLWLGKEWESSKKWDENERKASPIISIFTDFFHFAFQRAMNSPVCRRWCVEHVTLLMAINMAFYSRRLFRGFSRSLSCERWETFSILLVNFLRELLQTS